MRVYVTELKLYANILYDEDKSFENFFDIISANSDGAYALIESFGGGKDFEYDKELDAYKCSIENYKKWSSFCKRQKRLDFKLESLQISYGYVNVEDAEIDYSCEFKYQESLEKFLDDFQREKKKFIEENYHN